MSETTHTSGPRIVKRFDDAQIVVLGPLVDGRRDLIGTFTGARRAVNATLDAAAPDLLEACMVARAALEAAVGNAAQLDAAIEAIDAAVARAVPLAAALAADRAKSD